MRVPFRRVGPTIVLALCVLLAESATAAASHPQTPGTTAARHRSTTGWRDRAITVPAAAQPVGAAGTTDLTSLQSALVAAKGRVSAVTVQLSAAQVPVARLTSSVGTFTAKAAALSHDLTWATATVAQLAPRAAALQGRIQADRSAVATDTGTTQQRFTAYNHAAPAQRPAALAALRSAGAQLAAAQAALSADASAYSTVLSQLLAARQTVAWDTPLLAAAEASEASCATQLRAAIEQADQLGRALIVAQQQVATLARQVGDAEQRLRALGAAGRPIAAV
ncbi:hypothetical protein QDR37_09025 [Amnibacterium sp. CER49]|uniref:hypothetical protein n=1 Tax=Amnibacterium sp. CER49 TaxID=3039161 RepID=UPI002449F04A|nr:hypothetical protein [Amnibacterium sp. CER49]MDH2444086.1 hypothetical protein [Amnibacterium sp. CER49]